MGTYPTTADLAAMREAIARHPGTPLDTAHGAGFHVNTSTRYGRELARLTHGASRPGDPAGDELAAGIGAPDSLVLALVRPFASAQEAGAIWARAIRQANADKHAAYWWAQPHDGATAPERMRGLPPCACTIGWYPEEGIDRHEPDCTNGASYRLAQADR